MQISSSDFTQHVREDYSVRTSSRFKIKFLALNRFCLVNQHDEEHDETFEVAIVCFPETEAEMKLSSLTFTMKAILIFTSVAFLLLTLYIYLRLPELRETQVTSAITLFILSV